MLGAHGECTAAMQEAIRLSMQPGMLDMNAEETASFIAAHRETINQGVSDALAKGMNEIPPEVVFTFADLPKAIYLRNLVLQRRMSREGLEGGDQKIVPVTDEATRELLTKAYSYLTETTKTNALRKAQLYLKRESQYSHPIHWASMQSFGI